MAQNDRIVGIDVSKAKVDAFVRSLGIGISQPSTPAGERKLIGWLRENAVQAAVLEASGGYEKRWAAVLQAADVSVRIVDPNRVRHFAKSAGRLAKNDPIDAEMIAWFAETFSGTVGFPHEPDREKLDRFVTARVSLLRLQTQIVNQDEHEQPRRSALVRGRALEAAQRRRAWRPRRRFRIEDAVDGPGCEREPRSSRTVRAAASRR